MRFLKADKLFDGESYLQEDAVLVLDTQNVLKEIVSLSGLDEGKVEHLEGVLTPGFVNTHCHLELSHLKEKIPQHTGLALFAQEVVSRRNTISLEEREEHMQTADEAMCQQGIVAVGDISNTAESFNTKQESKLFYHTFVELIGLRPEQKNAILERGDLLLRELQTRNLRGSLAPHAPYSTSLELIEAIARLNYSNKLPLSIHNQESEEETKFFKGEKNGFQELYRHLGIDISWYKAPGTSSLNYYLEALGKTPGILVHNTVSTAADIEKAETKSVFWCFCPSANMYIENLLPNFSLFERYKNKICLGTDSLASNTELNMVKEANHLFAHTNGFSQQDLLKALTSNGAEALGISENFGRWMPGKNTGINQIKPGATHMTFIKKIA